MMVSRICAFHASRTVLCCGMTMRSSKRDIAPLAVARIEHRARSALKHGTSFCGGNAAAFGCTARWYGACWRRVDL